MRRVALLSVILSLVISCAVPTGAVFASEELIPSISEEPVVADEVVIQEETMDSEEAELQELPSEIVPSSTPNALAIETSAVIIEPPEPLPAQAPLPPQRKVYVTAFQITNALGFVELYNSDTKTQSINTWRLIGEFADGGQLCEVALSGYILPKTKVLLARAAAPGISNALMFTCGEASRVVTSLLLYDGDQIIERLLPPPTDDQIWIRKNTTSTYLTGTFLQDFKTDDEYIVTDGYWYIPPLAPHIKMLEVHVNPKECVTPDNSADCYDYIKIKNTSSSDDLDLSDYRLRSGFSNSTASASNTTYSSIVLSPGEVRTLTHNQDGSRISFSANDGTVWFEDIEGVVSFPTDAPPYVGSDLTSNKGRSWAYNDETGQWQWATPAPFMEENDFTPPPQPGRGSGEQPQELVPCRGDQYRSEETNRCRNIVLTSVLNPCSEGQYRSEETNRCRSIAATAASVLKPCADDQFRSPTTNRCRKIASSEDVALADCGEGRERNPETNRCRNVLGVSNLAATMPFPVEETPEGLERFAGWWVIGAIAALGAGYGIWEWRVELLGIGRKAGRFITGKK